MRAKSKWLIRIETGEEVIRRHCDAPKNADEQTRRSAARKTVEDEGYEQDLTNIDTSSLVGLQFVRAEMLCFEMKSFGGGACLGSILGQRRSAQAGELSLSFEPD